MCWIIPLSSLTRRDYEFLNKCKNNAVNKSIPIIDESDPNYFPEIEDNLPIPIIVEDKMVKPRKKSNKEISAVNYISAMSKEHEQLSRKRVLVKIQQLSKKRKKNKSNN
jgi:hypothetical protein